MADARTFEPGNLAEAAPVPLGRDVAEVMAQLLADFKGDLLEQDQPAETKAQHP